MTKQNFIMDGLTRKQQEVLSELEKQNQKLQDEDAQLIKEEEDLQIKIRQAKKVN